MVGHAPSNVVGQSIESFVGGGAVENEEEGQAHQVVVQIGCLYKMSGLDIDQALQVVGHAPSNVVGQREGKEFGLKHPAVCSVVNTWCW